jgi:pSer/pThr/pTyr-binding forkhead associated (FHA) protein
MTDGDGERIGRVRRRRLDAQPEERLHHPLDLCLLSSPVAAHGLLDPRRCVFGAFDAGHGACDEHGSPRLTDRERDAGVGADVRLLERDGIRGVRLEQPGDALEDRLQPRLGAFACAGPPPAVVDRPEAAVAFVDDPVPASSRPWVDADDDLHAETVRGESDDPGREQGFRSLETRKFLWDNVCMGETTLTLPDGSEHRLEGQVAVGRDEVCDVRLESKTVSRRHALIFERDGRWWIADTGSFNGTFINDDRVPPGVALQLHHADRIRIGSEKLVFSDPAAAADEDQTEPYDEPVGFVPCPLSPLQLQIVRLMCEPWLSGGSLEDLPSNEEIAARLGTPGATGTVKAALRRAYAKTGLKGEPAHAKRRAICRTARQRGWI